MAVERMYICNLCRERAMDANDLVGLHWAAQGLERRHALNVEHHICKRCLGQLGVIAGEVEMESVREDPSATPPKA